jgi:CDP-ribitol ribitolphosphotransferase / teichoic acid ribitol-phosphate polymerase
MIRTIEIKDFLINDNSLNISAVAKFKSKHNYKPRMQIVFSNDVENRRLPFIIHGFNRDSDSKICYIDMEWSYKINHLFWNKEFIGDIKIDFSLIYGEEIIENFLIIFDSISDSNFKSNNSFYVPTLNNNNLVLKAKKNELKAKNENLKKYSIISVLNSFFLLFIGIIALPFFFLDGFLASKDLTDKSPDFFRGNTPLKSILFHINWRTYKLSGHMYSKRLFKIWIMKCLYRLTKHKKIKNDRITFMSERRDDLTGNFEFVYSILKRNTNLEIVQFLNNKKIKDFNIKDIIRYAKLIGTSKVIVLDDFYPNIHNFELKKDTSLIQLWHAVGAFKTFGFSRLGKIGGTNQESKNHRNYDYAIVSSDEIKRFYAEGFGLSDEKIVATGIPRTDVFFEKEFKIKKSEEIYEKYPIFRNKKVILFAPTFRGTGKDDAFYPMDKFKIKDFLDSLDNVQDYILIIKHHPFIKEKTKIPTEYKDICFDLSENSEINDILFITDLLITDYSSVIFESSILNIPTLFYCHDLEEYVRDRDFYYDYGTFVPGKIVFNINELSKSINNNDFDISKVSIFKNRFFNDFDGKSSQRVANLILNLIDRV